MILLEKTREKRFRMGKPRPYLLFRTRRKRLRVAGCGYYGNLYE
jgi:hypothetical protein